MCTGGKTPPRIDPHCLPPNAESHDKSSKEVGSFGSSAIKSRVLRRRRESNVVAFFPRTKLCSRRTPRGNIVVSERKHECDAILYDGVLFIFPRVESSSRAQIFFYCFPLPLYRSTYSLRRKSDLFPKIPEESMLRALPQLCDSYGCD